MSVSYYDSVYAAVEDRLSEAVLKRLMKEAWNSWSGTANVKVCGGISNLKVQVPKLNDAACHIPVIVLADVDLAPCVVQLLTDWVPQGLSPRMCLRFAVREVESWLLADDRGLANFLSISQALVPANPDQLPDPKSTIIGLAKRSRQRRYREGIPPAQNSTSHIGPLYNDYLITFVEQEWNIHLASQNSSSLGRAMRVLRAKERDMLTIT